MHAVGMRTRLSDEIRVESGRSDIRHFSLVSVSKWPTAGQCVLHKMTRNRLQQ